MEENKTSFDPTVINPDVIIGPMIHPVLDPRSVNESNRFAIYNFMDGSYQSVDSVRFPDYHFVSLNTSPTFERICLTRGHIRWMLETLLRRMFSP